VGSAGGLAWRGTRNILQTLVATAKLKSLTQSASWRSGFNVAGNSVSLMNGGKDFSRWNPHGRNLYRLFRAPVELALGRGGSGMADIAIGECLLESNLDGDYAEAWRMVSQGVSRAQVSGQQRNHIASGFIHRQDRRIFRLMLQVRRNGAHGDPDSAYIYKGALFPEGCFRPASQAQAFPCPYGLSAERCRELFCQSFPPVGKGKISNSLSHVASLHSRSSVSASAVLPSSP